MVLVSVSHLPVAVKWVPAKFAGPECSLLDSNGSAADVKSRERRVCRACRAQPMAPRRDRRSGGSMQVRGPGHRPRGGALAPFKC